MAKGDYKPGDKIVQKYHPEWGYGIIRSVGIGGGMIIADWQHHVQQVPLPSACVEHFSGAPNGEEKNQ